jgi:hypothetical protein
LLGSSVSLAQIRAFAESAEEPAARYLIQPAMIAAKVPLPTIRQKLEL